MFKLTNVLKISLTYSVQNYVKFLKNDINFIGIINKV